MEPFKKAFRLMTFFYMVFTIGLVFAQNETSNPNEAESPQKLTLVEAVMCESIKNYLPYNAAIVFSTKIGSVSCFSAFDPVPKKTFIYHSWFNRDTLITVKKLTLNPPKWSSFSSIQLRESDKGPWRVEINNEDGEILKTIRFSITE